MASDNDSTRSDTTSDLGAPAARVRQEALSTFGPRVMKLGAPAGLFRLDFDEKIFRRNYRNPVLVSVTTCAPSSRAAIAMQTGYTRELAMDVAALCMNDILTVGAEPLFLQHHLAGALCPEVEVSVVEGLAESCRQAGCALLSSCDLRASEVRAADGLHLAVFCVGVVDHRRLITGGLIEPGDEVIGVAATGLHGPAFQAACDALVDDAAVDGPGAAAVEELLRPATVYAAALLRILRYYRRKRVVAGIVHVHQGFFVEEITRILPQGCGVQIDSKSWPAGPSHPLPPAAECWASEAIGLVLIVRPTFTQSITKQLQRRGLHCRRIGEVITGARSVQILEA